MAQPLKRLVIGLPHLAALHGEDSILLNRKGVIAELAKRSRVFRLSPSGPSASPEAAWLGMDPEQWSFEQGPLTFSWLKLSPPERSLCFHLSFASLRDGLVQGAAKVQMNEVKDAVSTLKRLDSKRLTLVEGQGLDHGLAMMDASPDLFTFPLMEVKGREWEESFPRGDEADHLRQWIEDAHELLLNLDINRRLRDEGLDEVNLAWPWGQGRPGVGFNLPLRRGIVTRHVTRSIRIAGLARLFGERVEWGGRDSLDKLSSKEPTVIVMPEASSTRQAGDLDEMDHFLKGLEGELLKPLLEENQSGFSVTLLAPQDAFDAFVGRGGVGLGLNFNTERSSDLGGLPFDERIIWDAEGKEFPLHEAVTLALMGGSGGQ